MFWNIVVSVTLLDNNSVVFFVFFCLFFIDIKQRYSTPFYLSVKAVIFLILEDEQKIQNKNRLWEHDK